MLDKKYGRRIDNINELIYYNANTWTPKRTNTRRHIRSFWAFANRPKRYTYIHLIEDTCSHFGTLIWRRRKSNVSYVSFWNCRTIYNCIRFQLAVTWSQISRHISCRMSILRVWKFQPLFNCSRPFLRSLIRDWVFFLLLFSLFVCLFVVVVVNLVENACEYDFKLNRWLKEIFRTLLRMLDAFTLNDRTVWSALLLIPDRGFDMIYGNWIHLNINYVSVPLIAFYYAAQSLFMCARARTSANDFFSPFLNLSVSSVSVSLVFTQIVGRFFFLHKAILIVVMHVHFNIESKVHIQRPQFRCECMSIMCFFFSFSCPRHNIFVYVIKRFTFFSLSRYHFVYTLLL